MRTPSCIWDHALSASKAVFYNSHPPPPPCSWLREWLPYPSICCQKKSGSWVYLWGLRPRGVDGAGVVRARQDQVGSECSQPAHHTIESSHLTITQAPQRGPATAPLDQPLVLLFPMKVPESCSKFLGLYWSLLLTSPTNKSKSKQ